MNDNLIARSLNPSVFVFLVNVGCLFGLLLGITLSDKSIGFPILGIGFLVSYADIIFIKFIPLVTVPIAVFTASSLILQVPFSEEGKIREIAIVQALTFLFLFLYVASGNWAFMPKIVGQISHGLAGLYLFLIGIVFFALTILRRKRE